MAFDSPNKVKVWYSGTDITPLLEDGWQLVGNVNIARRRRVTGTGQLGVSAYAVQLGLALTGTIRPQQATTLSDNGWVWIEDTNQSKPYVVAFYAERKGRPISSPSGDIVSWALNLMQSLPGAVEGDAVTTGNVSGAAGKITVRRNSSGAVSHVSTSTAASETAPILQADEWKAAG